MHSPNSARGPKKKTFLARHKPGRFVRHLGTMRQRRKDWRNTRSRTPGTTPVGITKARTRRFLKDKLPFPRTDARERARARFPSTLPNRAAQHPSRRHRTIPSTGHAKLDRCRDRECSEGIRLRRKPRKQANKTPRKTKGIKPKPCARTE